MPVWRKVIENCLDQIVWRAGLLKIRVRDDSGAYRVLYVANLEKAVYVLHTFQKKTRATSKREIELAQKRFRELMKEQK